MNYSNYAKNNLSSPKKVVIFQHLLLCLPITFKFWICVLIKREKI